MERRESICSAHAHCVVCGRESRAGLCDRCRESLALCDVEDFVARKAEGKIYRPARLNAFK